MKNLALITLLCTFVFLGTATSYAVPPRQSGKEANQKKDTMVEPTSTGDVVGHVYDAITGQPLPNVAVDISEDASFDAKGPGYSQTDDRGEFKSKAILGRISKNFDLGRALVSGLLWTALGGATNTTKRIDVTQVCAHVEATGYKTYEGVVRAQNVNAAAFRVVLQPILLVPQSADGASTDAPGWGAVRLERVSVQPAIAKPGEKLVVTADVATYGKTESGATKLSIVADLPEAANTSQFKSVYRQFWNVWPKMKLQSTDADGTAHYIYEMKAAKSKQPLGQIVFVGVGESDLDIDESQATGTAFLQVIDDESQNETAQQRDRAMQDFSAGKTAQAQEEFTKLAESSDKMDIDFEILAIINENSSDFAEAAKDRAAVYENAPKDKAMAALSLLTKDLAKAAQFDQVISVAEPVVEAIPKKDWKKKVPDGVVADLGIAYIKSNELDKAKDFNDALVDRCVGSGSDPDVAEFHDLFRLAAINTTLDKNPNDAAGLADYGRLFMDEGKWEQAAEKLQSSLSIDPTSNAVKRDLVYASLHIQRVQTAQVDLDAAIASARSQVLDAKGMLQSKDFYSWHAYASLLCEKYLQLKSKGEENPDALADCLSALRQALHCGRAGASKDEGNYNFMFGYMSGSQVDIAGFAYPEANSDFVIMESLLNWKDHPDDYLISFNLASALVDIGQLGTAEPWLQKALNLKPDFCDGRFLQALLDYKDNNLDVAKKELLQVVAENPRHSKASLLLADIYGQEGDSSSMAATMAMHNRVYGPTEAGR